MSIDESSWIGDRGDIVLSGQSGGGPLAAMFLTRRIPGVRFGPFRDEDFPVAICVLLCFGFTLLAYLMFS